MTYNINSISKEQNGSVAIMYVMLLPVLLVSMGIALDLGKYFIVKSEVQNAADACALAAAYELDGTGSQFTRAEAAGLNLAAANSAYFQQNAVSNGTVEFSTAASGSYAGSGGAAANAGFVRCSLNQPNVTNWFLQLIGIGNQTIPATAVATNVPAQTTCALPIGICEADAPAGTPPGTWLEGIQSAQGGENGFFRWIDFSPPAGGASEINGILNGANTCSIEANDPNLPLAENGVIAGANDHYNTRFGIKANGNPDISNAVPDTSGYAYYDTNWPSKFNAYADFVGSRRPINAPYQDPLNGITLNGNPTILSSAQLAAQGRNRRVEIAPVIDCNTITLKRWACIFLLHPMGQNGGAGSSPRMYIEYLGDANGTGPCRDFSVAGPSDGAGPKVSALVQ